MRGLGISGGTISGATAVPNLLINPCADIVQRQATATTLTNYADDTYCADRWYMLTQTDVAQFQQSTGDTNSVCSGLIKQTQAVAQRMGIAQLVESVTSLGLRGKAVRFQTRIKCSASQAIRVAILEWTGTADSITSDFVSDWTSTDYTAGASKFFSNTSWTVLGNATVTPSAATWTDLAVVANVSTSANNIAVVIWTGATAAQNVTLAWTQAGLYAATTPMLWNPRTVAEERSLCLNYYEAGTYSEETSSDGTLPMLQIFNFQAPKRAAPTVAYQDFNGTPNASKFSYYTTDVQAHNKTGTIDSVTVNGFRAYTDATTSKNGFAFTWTATAEL